ncbi:MAG: ligase-associated DNA damage response exonuclease [Lysobacterales bacterium]
MTHDLLQLRPEGLYCPAGDFWIDPWRPVPNAIITHAHADHARAGMQSYVSASEGIDLLHLRVGLDASIESLAYGEQRRLGAATVSLHPAGHIRGSSQVRVAVGDEVWVVTGDFKRQPDPTCTPFEVVRCDALITEATFAYPVYRWPATSVVAAQIMAWRRHCAERGAAALLLCYALGKAQRLLAELALLTDEIVLLHGAMVGLTDLYRLAGVAMLPIEPVGEKRGAELAGRLVLAPPSAAGSPWMRRFDEVETAFASGWMQVRGHRRRRGHDRGFVLSDHADWSDLIRTVLESGARRVLATHGQQEVLARYLKELGVEATALRTQYGGDD